MLSPTARDPLSGFGAILRDRFAGPQHTAGPNAQTYHDAIPGTGADRSFDVRADYITPAAHLSSDGPRHTVAFGFGPPIPVPDHVVEAGIRAFLPASELAPHAPMQPGKTYLVPRRPYFARTRSAVELGAGIPEYSATLTLRPDAPAARNVRTVGHPKSEAEADKSAGTVHNRAQIAHGAGNIRLNAVARTSPEFWLAWTTMFPPGRRNVSLDISAPVAPQRPRTVTDRPQSSSAPQLRVGLGEKAPLTTLECFTDAIAAAAAAHRRVDPALQASMTHIKAANFSLEDGAHGYDGFAEAQYSVSLQHRSTTLLALQRKSSEPRSV